MYLIFNKKNDAEYALHKIFKSEELNDLLDQILSEVESTKSEQNSYSNFCDFKNGALG